MRVTPEIPVTPINNPRFGREAILQALTLGRRPDDAGAEKPTKKPGDAPGFLVCRYQ
jgi:hypothetical protein